MRVPAAKKPFPKTVMQGHQGNIANRLNNGSQAPKRNRSGKCLGQDKRNAHVKHNLAGFERDELHKLLLK